MEMPDRKPGRLSELTEDECWERIRSRPIGRIAWAGSDGISVVPVNYAVDEHEIVLRTSPYSALGRECTDRDVAFQVDEIDEGRHAGWSVLLRGRCQREDRASGPSPWAGGRRVLGLRIEIRSMTGRRVLSPED